MRTRKKGYWICLALALVALIAALLMKGSADKHMQEYAKFVGYGAIVFVLIGRLIFGRTAQPSSPMPKD